MAHCTRTLKKIKQAGTDPKYHSPYCTDKLYTQVVSSMCIYDKKITENKYEK
jgi:hypothetical protein